MNRLERHLRELSLLSRREFVKALPVFRGWCNHAQLVEPPYFLASFWALWDEKDKSYASYLRQRQAIRVVILWTDTSAVQLTQGFYGFEYFIGKVKPPYEESEGRRIMEAGGSEESQTCWECGRWTDDPEGICQGCATGDDGGDYPDDDEEDDSYYDYGDDQ